jgi:hypothetical protein
VSHRNIGFGLIAALLLAAPASAQTLGVGGTIGIVNDIENHFHWEDFNSKDWNILVESEVQPKVIVRVTYGQLRVKGENAGTVVTPPGSTEPVTLPDLTNDVHYATLGVSYEFFEGTYTSGIFAGIGGYKFEPREVPEEIANYRDNRETAFGWHFGVDGGFQIIKHLSLVGRLTFHSINSTFGRSLLTAGAGLTYRF